MGYNKKQLDGIIGKYKEYTDERAKYPKTKRPIFANDPK